MLLTVLAAAAAISATDVAKPASAIAPETKPVAAVAVLLSCAVKEAGLTDCQALDADGATAAAAVKLAEQVEVAESFALSNPGRIVIKMNVNP